MLRKICLIELFPYSSRRIPVSLSTEAQYTSFESANSMSTEHFSQIYFNFIEGNGLMTEVILNDIPERANYLLVMDDNVITSRWFVIEKNRVTNYDAIQYRLFLRRDVLADYPDAWLNTPAFIQKGTITDNYSPLLFNKEDMTFNAIKRREIQLPDETGMQWIVGYIARNATLTDEAKKLNGAIAEFSSDAQKPLPNAIVFATLDDLYKALGLPNGADSFSVVSSSQAKVNIIHRYPIGSSFSRTESKALDGSIGSSPSRVYQTLTYVSDLSDQDLASFILSGLDPLSLLKTAIGTNVVSPRDFNRICGYAGRTVYVTATGLNYSISVTPDESQSPSSETVTPEIGSPLFSDFENAVVTTGDHIKETTGKWGTGSFSISYLLSMHCSVSLNQLASGAVQVTLTDPKLRPHLKDAPYDIFCIPYGNKPIKTSEGDISSSKDFAWAAAVALVENLASGTYDLQLLPYCPAREILSSQSASPQVGGLDATGMEVDFAYKGTAKKDAEGNYTSFERQSAAVPIIWCGSSNESFIITPSLPSDFSFPSDPTEVKVRNETSKARIVSPNLSGGFDFSPMMNGGVRNFRVDCTFRPFNPYIHVAPVFAHMYGGDFQDARGLVCGGDFSLPRITDAWESYQQQNKNYQAVFDREIQNLEVTQRYQRISEAFGAASGTLQGSLSGAMAGSLIPGIGTAIGAAAGTMASAAGGIADLAMGESMRAEAVDYRKDLFGYQLGNIRALPYSLAKSAAQNANNRPFPFIELYRASDEEIQALRYKLTYDGMTVGVIGEASDYCAGYPCFIQGTIAGAKPYGCDSDIWNAIVEEFAKGCYAYLNI